MFEEVSGPDKIPAGMPLLVAIKNLDESKTAQKCFQNVKTMVTLFSNKEADYTPVSVKIMRKDGKRNAYVEFSDNKSALAFQSQASNAPKKMHNSRKELIEFALAFDKTNLESECWAAVVIRGMNQILAPEIIEKNC